MGESLLVTATDYQARVQIGDYSRAVNNPHHNVIDTVVVTPVNRWSICLDRGTNLSERLAPEDFPPLSDPLCPWAMGGPLKNGKLRSRQ